MLPLRVTMKAFRGLSRNWTEPVWLAVVCASWFPRFSQYVGDRGEEEDGPGVVQDPLLVVTSWY